MLAQHVNHGPRNPLSGKGPESVSPLSSRHPLVKLILGGGMLAGFLLLPDRTVLAVAGKLAVLLGIFFFSGGRGRWRILLRGGEALAGFLAVFLLCALLGDLFSSGSSRALVLPLALKSFWALAVSLLLFGTLNFAECVYLSGLLWIPSRVSSQILLIILIGKKIVGEFRRVPAAWKSRGLTPGCLRRHPFRIAGVLSVVLVRVICQGIRLERALIGRGFAGKFYTVCSARWRPADTAVLLVFLTAGLGLVAISALR